jgi:hypothetical protein
MSRGRVGVGCRSVVRIGACRPSSRGPQLGLRWSSERHLGADEASNGPQCSLISIVRDATRDDCFLVGCGRASGEYSFVLFNCVFVVVITFHCKGCLFIHPESVDGCLVDTPNQGTLYGGPMEDSIQMQMRDVPMA